MAPKPAADNINDKIAKSKRVIFPAAGKGGVGKTSVLVELAGYLDSKNLKVDLIDMDPDNKGEGSLQAFFPTRAKKMPAFEKFNYDALGGLSMDSDADVIVADMGAAQGHQLLPWFEEFYRVMQATGTPLRWTAVCVVDSDAASARTVLEWGAELQDSVDYLIVRNRWKSRNYNCAWDSPLIAEDVKAFKEAFNPIEVILDERRSDLQELSRSHSKTMQAIAEQSTGVPELSASDMAFRARSYVYRAKEEFTKAGRILLP